MASQPCQLISTPKRGRCTGHTSAIQAGTNSPSSASTAEPRYSSRTHYEMSASAPALSVGSM